MIQNQAFSFVKNQEGRLYPTINMSGPKQMATDVMLLEKMILKSNASLAIRFYNWEGFWLSIGKNQKDIPKSWLELVQSRRIKIVRRPSGGNAVLHGGGLTYALIWISPPRKKREAYYLASQWLIKGFYNLGLDLRFGSQSTNPIEKNCFATSTYADLIDPEGNKRIGSAQLWRKGHLLQHGEILLDPPPKLWMDIFETKAPKPAPNHIPREGLDHLLHAATCAHWPEVNWRYKEFNQEELKQVSLKAEKYSLRAD